MRGDGPGVAIDHDVDAFADRFAHRGHAGFGVADRLKPFDGRGFWDGHALESGVTVGDGLPGEIGEASGVGGARLIHRFHFSAAEMAVSANIVADRAAPEFVTGDAMHFAKDVPQGDVDAADRRSADDACGMPKVLAVHHLPKVLDPCGVFANQELGDIFHRTDDGARVPLERGFPPAPKTWLVGEDFDEHPVTHAGVAHERFDLGNFHEVIRINEFPLRQRRASPDQTADPLRGAFHRRG